MGQQSKNRLKLLMDILDERSRKIFWYLRRHEHAMLSELAELIDAATDMEVLHRLRGVLNLEGERIFGRPIVEFSESRVDRKTGEKLLFNWWLTDFDDGESMSGEERSLVDIFDENDHMVIICEIPPSTKLSDRPKVEQNHGILSIKLDKLL